MTLCDGYLDMLSIDVLGGVSEQSVRDQLVGVQCSDNRITSLQGKGGGREDHMEKGREDQSYTTQIYFNELASGR